MSFLNQLHVDILVELNNRIQIQFIEDIFIYCGFASTVNAMRVSKAWKEIIAQKVSWRRLVEKLANRDKRFRSMVQRITWKYFIPSMKGAERRDPIWSFIYRFYFNHLPKLKEWNQRERELPEKYSSGGGGIFSFLLHGKWAICGTGSGEIEFWDLSQETAVNRTQVKRIIQAHTYPIQTISANENHLASGTCSQPSIKLWDLNSSSPTPISVISAHRGLKQLCLVNGFLLGYFTWNDPKVVVWKISDFTTQNIKVCDERIISLREDASCKMFLSGKRFAYRASDYIKVDEVNEDDGQIVNIFKLEIGPAIGVDIFESGLKVEALRLIGDLLLIQTEDPNLLYFKQINSKHEDWLKFEIPPPYLYGGTKETMCSFRVCASNDEIGFLFELGKFNSEGEEEMNIQLMTLDECSLNKNEKLRESMKRRFSDTFNWRSGHYGRFCEFNKDCVVTGSYANTGDFYVEWLPKVEEEKVDDS